MGNVNRLTPSCCVRGGADVENGVHARFWDGPDDVGEGAVGRGTVVVAAVDMACNAMDDVAVMRRSTEVGEFMSLSGSASAPADGSRVEGSR